MDVEWKDRNKFIKRQSGRRFDARHELLDAAFRDFFSSSVQPCTVQSTVALLCFSLVSFDTMSSAEATAKMELEAARAEIIRHEKQIQDVKGALRQLQSASSADGGEEAPNTLEIAVLKVNTRRIYIFCR
jgi:hypothetical protein